MTKNTGHLNKEISIVRYFQMRIWILLFNRVPNHKFFDSMRNLLLKKAGFTINGNVKVFAPLYISPKTITANIFLEGNLFINSGARFSAPIGTCIRIEKNCLIGPNVTFETVNHNLEYSGTLARGSILGNIIINEGVWIGANTLILQNVEVGKGSVIGASSLVSKNIKADCVAAGVPCKFIKRIDEGTK